MQTGILHPSIHPKDPSTLKEQPSLIYHFAVPSTLFKNGEEIQVRLTSEVGEFVYLVQQGAIPQYDNFFDQEDNKGYWHGFEIQDVFIRKDDVVLQTEGDELINFFVRVYPYMDPLALANNSTNAIQKQIAYKFNLAYYDEDQYVMLKDGYP